MFEYTPLYRQPQRYFNGLDVLLGDSAYKASKTIVIPYPNPGNNQLNRDFNYLHARGRLKSENAIGLWKNKFKIAGSTIRLKTIPNIIMLLKASLVIHNMVIQYHIDNRIEEDNNIDDQFESDLNVVQSFRQHRALSSRSSSDGFERRETMKMTNN